VGDEERMGKRIVSMLFLSGREKCNGMVQTTSLEVDRSERRSRESNVFFVRRKRVNHTYF
jgi:hypothetical protein